MSLKAIKRAVQELEGVLDHPNAPAELRAVWTEAQAEIEALEKTTKMLPAAVLAFDYIGDRSAGSAEAWGSLARALGMDEEDAYASEMIEALKAIALEDA